MVDPLSLFNIRTQKVAAQKPAFPVRGKTPAAAMPSQTDSVELESLSLRATLKEQAGVLKQELPGIIADAVKAHADNDAVRNAPVTATRIRLEKPLQSILDRGNSLPPSLVQGLKTEIQSLQNALPDLRDHAVLSPFDADPEKEEVLNGILFDVSDQMDRLMDLLGRLA